MKPARSAAHAAVARIGPGATSTRTKMDQQALAELAESIPRRFDAAAARAPGGPRPLELIAGDAVAGGADGRPGGSRR